MDKLICARRKLHAAEEDYSKKARELRSLEYFILDLMDERDDAESDLESEMGRIPFLNRKLSMLKEELESSTSKIQKARIEDEIYETEWELNVELTEDSREAWEREV